MIRFYLFPKRLYSNRRRKVVRKWGFVRILGGRR